MEGLLSQIFFLVSKSDPNPNSLSQKLPEKKGDNMIVIIIILLVLMVVFTIAIKKMTKRSDERENQKQKVDREKIKKDITEYFEEFYKDRKKFELSEYKTIYGLDWESYKRKVKIKVSLLELGYNLDEIEIGKSILQELIKDITGSIPVPSLTESDLMVFLIKYNELKAQYDALLEIIEELKKISASDKKIEEIKREIEDTENEIKKLINDLGT